jgi:hypothetical protein
LLSRSFQFGAFRRDVTDAFMVRSDTVTWIPMLSLASTVVLEESGFSKPRR